MKLIFDNYNPAPDHYTIDGELITVHHKGQSETIDLSELEHGDKFEGVEPEVIDLDGGRIITDAYRDEHGELHVRLVQLMPLSGHWRESLEYDASEYVPGRQYIRELRNGVLVEPSWPEDEFEDEVIEPVTPDEPVMDPDDDDPEDEEPPQEPEPETPIEDEVPTDET
jgi:hypothetical protein